MMRFATLALPAAVFLASLALTGWFRRYALARRLLDVPNERSSHTAATPRAGGAAIVLATFAGLIVVGALGITSWRDVIAALGGGLIVAAAGFADDLYRVAPRWRMLAHFAGAAWVLAWLGPAQLPVFGFASDLRWALYLLEALYIVWLINLTNFMDGIDGIAAVETVTVCVGAALLSRLPDGNNHASLTPIVLSAAALGFLVWNWPPAKIFMGDVGSGFIGLMLAVLSLQAAQIRPALFWSWLILLGVFVVDSGVTLARRVLHRERFYEPHRSHAYQHGARRLGAHLPVTLAVGAINAGWLFPLAYLVAVDALNGPTALLVAYLPLVGAAMRLEAGRPAAV